MKKKDWRGWLYPLVEVYSTMTQQYTLKMSVRKETFLAFTLNSLWLCEAT